MILINIKGIDPTIKCFNLNVIRYCIDNHGNVICQWVREGGAVERTR